MFKFVTLFVLTLCLTLVVTFAAAEEKKPGSAEATKPQGLPVETVQAALAPLRNELTATGTLLANEEVVITAEIAGKVTQISFHDGQKVVAGQILLRLDPSVLSAERDRARASSKLSEANIRRAELLLKEQAISERERDEAHAQWQFNDASLRLSEAQLEKTVIRAPFSGLLGLRQISLGEYLQPGKAIVTLDDIDPIKVDFRVPEVFATQLKSGQKIRLNVDAVPGKSFAGEVYAIDPQIDVNGRSVRLRAKVVQQDGPLRPGMFARVTLILDQRPDALLIPEEALIPRGNQQTVYKVVEGKVVAAVVTTGQRTRGQVEILQGLSVGETVITAGQLKVRPGMPVTAIPSSTGAPRNGN